MELPLVIIIIFVVAFVFYLAGRSSNKQNEIVITTKFISDKDSESQDEVDNWESFNIYRAQMFPAKGNYRINYIDQKGLETVRDITIRKAFRDGNSYAVNAFCHLRNSSRTFINDRIYTAVDTDTAEVIDNVAEHSIKQYEDSDVGKMWRAINDQWVYIYVLLYVCKADGRIMSSEIKIMSEFVKNRCPSVNFNDDALIKAIKSVGAPDLREFKRLVLTMRKESVKDLEIIYEVAKQIINTQKTIDKKEIIALETIDKALKS